MTHSRCAGLETDDARDRSSHASRDSFALVVVSRLADDAARVDSEYGVAVSTKLAPVRR